MIRKADFLLISMLALLTSCSTVLEAPLDEELYGYEYYPLKVGNYRIYQIDSLQFDIGTANLPTYDSVSFFLREEAVELSKDLQGNEFLRIERHRSSRPEGPWTPVDVFTRSRSTNQAFSTEDNVRLINLAFPIREGLSWNGTSFINDRLIVFVRGESIEMYKDWQFRILSEGLTERIGNEDFQIATIQQVDTENPFERRYSIEKYAKGIGLVLRERQITDSFCKFLGDNAQCSGLGWREKSGRGFITREILIEHN